MDYTSTYDYATTTTVPEVDAGVVGAILAAVAGMWLVILIVSVFMIVCMWKIFTKAGKPGWAAIVPIYNIIVMLEIIGRPLWWILLLFVPVANLVISVIMALDLAKVFGKSVGFGVLSIFFPYVTYPMLAFGKATYTAPAKTE